MRFFQNAAAADVSRRKYLNLARTDVRGHEFLKELPMSAIKPVLCFAAALLVLGVFTGCESTDGGSVSGSTSIYYGTGFYDPWYYGGYHDHDDIVVMPPSRPVRPEQPIYRPSGPRPTPMPAIPSAPRPMPRGGGRR